MLELSKKYLEKYGWLPNGEAMDWSDGDLGGSEFFSAFSWNTETKLLSGYHRSPAGKIGLARISKVSELNTIFKVLGVKISKEYPDKMSLSTMNHLIFCMDGKASDLKFSKGLPQETIDLMWEKAKPVEGISSEMFRLDRAGAIIRKDLFAQKNEYGWVVDIINPSLPPNLDNLRPLNIFNDVAKGNDYPSYSPALEWNGITNVYIPETRSYVAK
ncbi:MAG: hypothetical protein J6I84_03790 [Bacilli bacterium]|nr:hypothetical protein [Bacilli bacterium]